jgi:hypothetical protein|tara:strand:+ start:6281 stop:6670 length:390 start_codon:yes stop_codon:yes gene_type:complete
MKNTIFDYVNAILHSKNKSVFTNMDDESTFSSYMINRWVSMYSPEMANMVNQTTNKYVNIFNTKQEFFNFYISVYPRLHQKRINYIKKTKSEKEKEEDEMLPLIAKAQEMSLREVKFNRDMVEFLQTTP